jgi:hypothetical protein
MYANPGDARTKIIVPTQKTMVDYLVAKVTAWVFRAALDFGGADLSSARNDWLQHEIGLSPELIRWAVAARPDPLGKYA